MRRILNDQIMPQVYCQNWMKTFLSKPLILPWATTKTKRNNLENVKQKKNLKHTIYFKGIFGKIDNKNDNLKIMTITVF